MSAYRIVTDAAADLTQKLARELDILVIPMECTLGETAYAFAPESEEIHPKTYYESMRNGAATGTSQINVFAYIDFFKPILEKGEDILCIALSSALTGSQQSAAIAIEELKKQFPDRRVLMVDSLGACMGEGLLAYAAARQRQAGLSLDELYSWAMENRRNIAHWFTVDDLKYLKRGGRLSAASALIGTALRIKPVLHVDEKGALVALDKVQGRKRSLKSLVERMKESYQPEAFSEVFIAHADCEEDARFVKAQIEETIGANVYEIGYIGPIIGAHAGPGTVALFHFATHK